MAATEGLPCVAQSLNRCRSATANRLHSAHGGVSDLSLRLIYGAVADELRLVCGVQFTTDRDGVKGRCYRASTDTTIVNLQSYPKSFDESQQSRLHDSPQEIYFLQTWALGRDSDLKFCAAPKVAMILFYREVDQLPSAKFTHWAVDQKKPMRVDSDLD